MQPSMFNVRVPLPDRDDVFLMNTFTDAQLIVSREVVSLLDSLEAQTDCAAGTRDADTQAALDTLAENGFVVTDRASERDALHRYFHDFRENTEQLRLTILTTL